MRRVFRLFRGDRPARGRRARVRWTIRLLFVLVLLVTVGGVLVLRSPVVAWVLASRLESTLGAQMESKGAVVNPGGSLIITGLRLRVPGVGGGAGEFLSAERVEVDLDWSGVWSGKVVPIGVRLYEPVFRVSLSTRDNSVNLAHLAARAGEGGGPGPAPRVDVIDGAVEFGEHEPGRYTALGVIPVTGSLTPLHRARPVYSVKLQQTGEPPSRVHGVRRVGGDMLLEGRVDLNESRGELRLHHFDLAAWPAGALPSGVRDIWASLAMRGQVTRSTFSYDDETGPQVRLEVRGVAMNVPVPADRPDAAPMEPMNLQGVSGDVRLSARGLAASLEGVIEDLPVRVSLRTEGTELNAALRCEILAERFTLRQSPDLLPYAPRVVRKRFAEFSGPTAVVDARVLLERGPPIGGVAAPLSASGTVAFDNGRAVFRDFPYPFEQVSGLVTFDEQGVHIVRVNGVGPTGARLLATGELTAPMDGPAVAIDVLVRGVALDPVLEAALEDKRGILEDLFNRRAYRRLLDEGLVISGRTSRELGLELAALRERRRAADQDPAGPERGADLDRQIAAIERRLGVPVFDLGGEADILVMVRAAAGKKQPVHHQVQVVIREAGMLPAAFPHPVMARDVIFQLDQDELRLIEGDFAGLTGGTAQVAARVLLETKARRHAEPHIQVRAVDVPIDGLLVRAIPEEFAAPRTEREQAGPAREPEGFSGKRLLENLRVEGTVACDVVIAPAGEGETTSDVRVRFADLAAIPRPRGPEPIGPPAGGGADTLAVTGLRGQVHIAGDEVTIPECEADLHRAWSHDPRGPVQALGPPAGHVALALTARLAEPSATTPAPLYASLLVSDLDLTSPMEDLIAVADPGVARSVADLLEARRPAGVLDAEVEVTRHASERPAVWLHLSNGRGVEADVLGDRLGVDLEAGSVTLHSGPPTSLHFDAAVARLSFAGQPAGSLRLDGRLALPSGAASPDPETALAVRAENATLEAPLVRLLVREAAPGARDLLDDLDPAG
ncbi:MAG TPA: hypothetical protein VD963_00520, partial [Phycisphaerales bacterium]|nr:hypothetical protein [Phycisphaerales bacterium]